MKNTAAAAAAARLSAADLQSPQTHKVKQMPIIEAGFEDGSSGEYKESPLLIKIQWCAIEFLYLLHKPY